MCTDEPLYDDLVALISVASTVCAPEWTLSRECMMHVEKDKGFSVMIRHDRGCSMGTSCISKRPLCWLSLYRLARTSRTLLADSHAYDLHRIYPPCASTPEHIHFMPRSSKKFDGPASGWPPVAQCREIPPTVTTSGMPGQGNHSRTHQRPYSVRDQRQHLDLGVIRRGEADLESHRSERRLKRSCHRGRSRDIIRHLLCLLHVKPRGNLCTQRMRSYELMAIWYVRKVLRIALNALSYDFYVQTFPSGEIPDEQSKEVASAPFDSVKAHRRKAWYMRTSASQKESRLYTK